MNSLKAERRDFRVRKVTDGSEGVDGSGMIAFHVSWLHFV